jgi:hypothetical protein
MALQATSGMLAVQVDYSIEDSITIFLAESIGCFVGLGLGIWLFQVFYCEQVLLSSLVASAASFIALAFVSNFVLLHVLFFILGCTFLLSSTSIQYLVCKIMGSDSGIWIATMQTCFLAGGTISMALRSFITIYSGLYIAIAIASLLIAFLCMCAPNAQSVLPYLDMYYIPGPHYWTELIIGVMLALVLGAFISMSYYGSYVLESTTSISSDTVEYELTIMWVCATIGSAVGLVDELFLDQALG